MKNLILVFTVLTMFVACKNNSPAAATKAEVKKTDSVVTAQSEESDNYRLVVLFYSIGEGTEFNFIKALEDSIKAYGAHIGRNIDYEKTAWGREGETDFCLRLNELNLAQQTEFIINTRDQLSKAKWVNIYENYPCKHKGKQ